MELTKEQAFELIKSFANIQVLITHQTNSRRGVTQKSIKEEKLLLGNLLDAMSIDYSKDDLNELSKNIS